MQSRERLLGKKIRQGAGSLALINNDELDIAMDLRREAIQKDTESVASDPKRAHDEGNFHLAAGAGDVQSAEREHQSFHAATQLGTWR